MPLVPPAADESFGDTLSSKLVFIKQRFFVSTLTRLSRRVDGSVADSIQGMPRAKERNIQSLISVDREQSTGTASK